MKLARVPCLVALLLKYAVSTTAFPSDGSTVGVDVFANGATALADGFDDGAEGSMKNETQAAWLEAEIDARLSPDASGTLTPSFATDGSIPYDAAAAAASTPGATHAANDGPTPLDDPKVLRTIMNIPTQMLRTAEHRPLIYFHEPRHGSLATKPGVRITIRDHELLPPTPSNQSEGPYVCVHVVPFEVKDTPLRFHPDFCNPLPRNNENEVRFSFGYTDSKEGWFTARAYLWHTPVPVGESQFSSSPFRTETSFYYIRNTTYVKSLYHRSVPHKSDPLVEHTQRAIELANRGQSKLNANTDCLTLQGMSGLHFRHFLNNLLDYPGARYLEVGLWQGSTFCAALANNSHNVEMAIGVDDWSQFQGPREQFHANLDTCVGGPRDGVRVMEMDFLDVAKQLLSEPEMLDSFQFYLFDGPHKMRDQYAAITYYYPLLAETSVVIVDDWNGEEIRLSTEAAIMDLQAMYGMQVLYRHTIDSTIHGEYYWHNGIGIYVLKKAGSMADLSKPLPTNTL